MSDIQAVTFGADSGLSRLDAVHEARLGRRIEGGFRMQAMERLAGMIVAPASDELARVDLGFGLDREGRECLVGTIRAEPRVVCQRCLEPMAIALAIDVRMALMTGPDDELPEGYESLATTDGVCDLPAIVEDEIILALPIVAMHPIEACAVDERYRGEILADGTVGDGETTRRPFAGLADLLAASKAKKG